MCCGLRTCLSGGWCVCFFFFFKQKTAYEMRISDWSSDVCSSDLGLVALLIGHAHRLPPAFEVAVAARQQLGGGLADLADAEGIDEAIEADGGAVLDRLHQLRRRLRTPALALGDPRFMRDEAEDIAGGGDQAIVEEGLDVLTAEPLDVEGVARDEMAQALVALRLADEATGAAAHHFAFFALRLAAADRAVVREDIGLAVLRPLLLYDQIGRAHV